MNRFQKPMQPWPALEPYARSIPLARGGLTLHLFDAGARDAPPMFLIHGLADEADTWRHLVPPLSTQYRVIAPDLPGFGRSEKPDRPYTVPFFRDVLLELLDTLEVQRAVLVGHSLGAVITHAFALSYRERVERLVLIGGSLVARSQKVDLATMLFLIPGLGEWLYNRLRKDPQAAYRTLEPYYRNLDHLLGAEGRTVEREFLFQRVNERVWSDGQRRAFLSAFRYLARWIPGQQRNLPSRLATLDVPTLVLWGEADRMAPVENGHALVELQSTARLVIVPGAGHNVHQEEPEAVVEALQAGSYNPMRGRAQS
jgi:pimeloyl-ACP methyl ester carboxylesterase